MENSDGAENGVDPLDIQDYLDATSDAATRTRTVTLVILITCVLVFAGLLNSLESHWMQQRVDKFRNGADPYVINYIGKQPSPLPADKDERERVLRLYDERYLTANRALWNALV